MRSPTAISLALLGGGVIAMAVDVRGHCRDPATGQLIACTTGSGSHFYIGHGAWTGSSGGFHALGGVKRGGFGAAGHAAGGSGS